MYFGELAIFFVTMRNGPLLLWPGDDAAGDDPEALSVQLWCDRERGGWGGAQRAAQRGRWGRAERERRERDHQKSSNPGPDGLA